MKQNKMKAIVEYLNSEKGYGFLKIEGYDKSVFFHVKDLVKTNFDDLRKGDEVSVEEVVNTPKGNCAKGISL